MSADVTVTFTADPSNTDAIIDRLRKVLSPTSLEGYLEISATPWIISRIKARFAGEGDDVVGRWQALRPATVAIREAKGFGGEHPINKRTGELLAWLSEPGTVTSGKAADGAALSFPNTASASQELLDKLKTAQVGKRVPPVTGARKVLGLNEKDAATMIEQFHVWFIGKFTGWA